MIGLFLKGLIMGFAIAAPVGPIGTLCIQRTLQQGWLRGFMTGLGAALADGSYGFIAAFGLTTITTLLIKAQTWIHFCGGLFLIYLALKLWFSSSTSQTSLNPSHLSIWRAISSTYFLTLANPATIMSFMAIFAGLGLGTLHPHFQQAILLVVGITLGSALWWCALSSGISFIIRHQLNQKILMRINRTAAIIILIFGIFALIKIQTILN